MHKHTGFDLRLSPFLSLPRPSKELCYSCDFVHGPHTHESQVFPLVVAGQLYLDVPVLLLSLGLGLQGTSSCRVSHTVPGI